ncbi:Bug family tripartite tricarboxylate transporter substrate binding protein [Tardiphaga sp. 839_C3_N1_4]|uniref:Bug family tripartite tricarboxylate transporter substrate binding protein n=1 Tax=Tardiphaga sp. 839_C3_N1_4 TaxID=3240761 RepID=UPI003F28EE5F
MSMRRALFVLLSVLCFFPPAQAEFPDRPVRLVVALPAGGSVDVVARILADRLRDGLGETVVVENRAGASGNIAAQSVATADADGYTLLFTTSAITSSTQLAATSFDPPKDLVAVTRVGLSPYVLVVRSESPITTLDDFVAKARSEPGTFSCSTYGVGSPPHLALEMLKQAAGLDIVHIPYRGFNQSYPDIRSGLLTCAMEVPANVAPFVKDGTLRALAVTTAMPMTLFAGVPTIASRFPNVVVEGWQGVFVPAATPQPIIDRLNAEFVKALRDPEVIQQLRKLGFEPIGDSSADADKIFRHDYVRFGATIESLKIR